MTSIIGTGPADGGGGFFGDDGFTLDDVLDTVGTLDDIFGGGGSAPSPPINTTPAPRPTTGVDGTAGRNETTPGLGIGAVLAIVGGVVLLLVLLFGGRRR